MVSRDLLKFVAKNIKKEFPDSDVYDSQSHKLKVGDFYIEIMSNDRDNKLHNKYVQRFMQDTSIRIIYYCGDEPDTQKVNEVEDYLLDVMQWIIVDTREIRARDVQCTYSMNKDTGCMVCVAKYYIPLIRQLSLDEDYMARKIDTNLVEEGKNE